MSREGSEIGVEDMIQQARVLAYHEFGTRASRDVYQMPVVRFEQHLSVICDAALVESGPVVTFDDAHLSQLTMAAPMLEAHGLAGLFFVPAGWVGTRRNTATWTELRGLIRRGHSVGSHGLTHKFLSSCTEAELTRELSGSKCELEQHLGIPINTLSLPGGRMSEAVLEGCAAAGYKRVYTSNPVQSIRRFHGRRGEDVLLVGRFAVRRSTTLRTLKNYMQGDRIALLELRLAYEMRRALQRGMGDALYQGLWRRLLRNRNDTDRTTSTADSEQLV